jgi:hypothetical protein
MDFGQAPIFAGRLDGGRGIDILAEGLHRDARRRRNVLVMRGGFRGRSFVLNLLTGLFHREPALLTSTR